MNDKSVRQKTPLMEQVCELGTLPPIQSMTTLQETSYCIERKEGMILGHGQGVETMPSSVEPLSTVMYTYQELSPPYRTTPKVALN